MPLIRILSCAGGKDDGPSGHDIVKAK